MSNGMNRLHYLATPYTSYPGGLELAHVDACWAAAVLIGRQIIVYSPIAHTHPIARYGNIDPINHKFWLDYDKLMMRRCDGLIVVKMEGWDKSLGVAEEIKAFQERGKPITYLTWPDLEREQP